MGLSTPERFSDLIEVAEQIDRTFYCGPPTTTDILVDKELYDQWAGSVLDLLAIIFLHPTPYHEDFKKIYDSGQATAANFMEGQQILLAAKAEFEEAFRIIQPPIHPPQR